MKRICSFRVVIERVPILTPIAIVWDKGSSNWTIGIMILCFVIGIQCKRKGEDEL